MKLQSAITALCAAVLVAACSPVPPLYFGPEPAWLPRTVNSEAINSVGFAVRPTPPGQPGYLDTIRYIDDGVRHIDPYAEFFISFDGQMCFRGLVNHQQAEFEYYQYYWCIYPTSVNNVDAIENDISYVNVVRLWCKHAAPQCARRYGIPAYLDDTTPIGNSISVQTVRYKQERDAIDHLIYLMGGSVESVPPSQRGLTSGNQALASAGLPLGTEETR